MTIDFDLTFVLQMVLFTTLIVVLKPLLFDPVLRILVEREKRTEGARAEARNLQEQAGELLDRYENELAHLQQVAREERDRERTETARLESLALEEARTAANTILERGRKEISQECRRVQADLDRKAGELARTIAMGVLGRPRATMPPSGPPAGDGAPSGGVR